MRVLSLMMGLTTLAASLVFTAQAQAGEKAESVGDVARGWSEAPGLAMAHGAPLSGPK